MNTDFIKNSCNYHWLKLNSIVMFKDQPVKLISIKRIRDKYRLEYEFENIFTKEKYIETIPDLRNCRTYWNRWSQGMYNHDIMLNSPILQKKYYQIMHVIMPNKISCLNTDTFEEKSFEIPPDKAINIKLTIDINPEKELQVTEICWRNLSTLEFEKIEKCDYLK